MDSSLASSKTAGRIGSLLLAIGLVLFFGGLFFIPREFMIGGIVLMAASLVGFYLEEYIRTKRELDGRA